MDEDTQIPTNPPKEYNHQFGVTPPTRPTEDNPELKFDWSIANIN